MIEFFYNNSIYIATSITSFFAIIKKYSRMKFSIKNHSKKIKINHELHNKNEKTA